MTDRDSLSVALHILTKMREADDRILAEAGLTWNQWLKIREEAAKHMHALGQKEINANGYRVELRAREHFAYPKESGTYVGESVELVVRSIREV